MSTIPHSEIKLSYEELTLLIDFANMMKSKTLPYVLFSLSSSNTLGTKHLVREMISNSRVIGKEIKGSTEESLKKNFAAYHIKSLVHSGFVQIVEEKQEFHYTLTENGKELVQVMKDLLFVYSKTHELILDQVGYRLDWEIEVDSDFDPTLIDYLEDKYDNFELQIALDVLSDKKILRIGLTFLPDISTKKVYQSMYDEENQKLVNHIHLKIISILSNNVNLSANPHVINIVKEVSTQWKKSIDLRKISK